MEIVPLSYTHDGFHLPLLKRPRPLPEEESEKQHGVYAEWKIRGFIHRDSGKVPRVSVKCTIRVRYATLEVEGRFPAFKLKIPLVSIGFVESSGLDFLDIRGRTFRLLLCGIDDIQTARDTLRYLIVRQRVPHAILGKEFDWKVEEVKEKQKKAPKISKWSPLNCLLAF
ncbi:hypothetical protein PRIPAC_97592 [Pristionchus pacificus]|uniref:Uncharacterized protein n=1 Tax=Pristionchus pacificus TaxID=54126 RepID=A0A454XPJ6_PRIPA|nr:hypothetical protein PRIPAC_97592 [Pristionchus pacificus]|eukprot:PDM66168.1 hypothetical protein PRIPAC_45393 [Pristionchus pacificus]